MELAVKNYDGWYNWPQHWKQDEATPYFDRISLS